MDDNFKTKIFVNDAHYDSQEQALILFVTIKMTGEKKVLCNKKSNWHYGSGTPGDFPDSEMEKLVHNIKGKTITWTLMSDPQVQQADAETMETIVKRVGMEMDELKEVLGSDERILLRKKEDLQRVEKAKTQEDALRRLKRQLRREKS